MRKQELIHMHGLLAEIADYCREDGDVTLETEDYDALGTRPTSIHQSKTAHKDAVFALSDAVTVAVDAGEEAVPANAD